MKYINADKLKQAIEKNCYFTIESLIFKLIDELSEEREDDKRFNLEDMRNCYVAGSYVGDNPNENFEEFINSLKQPTPLKVAIKGDGTEEYSKAIFQYFGKHTIKGQHDIGSFVCEVYYYIENDNIVFCPFLPKGYTEVSLKEGEKVVTDNSKVNIYLLNRVEELEKELIDLKLKLKELIN